MSWFVNAKHRIEIRAVRTSSLIAGRVRVLVTRINRGKRGGPQAQVLKSEIYLALRSKGAEAAIEAARDAITRFPLSADLWYHYGRVLLEANRRDAASESFALSLRMRPDHMMALEYFLITTPDGPRGTDARRALAAMAKSMNSNTFDGAGSLDFLIPYGSRDDLLLLSHTKNAAGSYGARFHLGLDGPNRGEGEARAAAHLDETARKVLEARVHLARDEATAALDIVSSLPGDTQLIDALRRCARRLLLGSEPEAAIPVLQTMRTLKPGDAWIEAKMKDVESSRFSDAVLRAKGFPIEVRADRPTYEPVDRKVFYLLHNSLPYHSAGYSIRTHGLLSELSRRGYKMEGVTRLGYPYDMPGLDSLPPIGRSDVVDKVRYSRLTVEPSRELKRPLHGYIQRYSRTLEEYAMEKRPALIHGASNHWNGLAAVNVANKLGIPSVYEIRGLWEVTRASREPSWAYSEGHQLIVRMEADAAAAATRVFTITGALREEMIHRGVDPAKITVIPNGVDTARFIPQQRDPGLVDELGIKDEVVIGYVGSVLDYEGIGLILEAAYVLRRERNDFKILIVGDGPELEKFKRSALERGQQSYVIFTGRVPHDQVNRYYSLIDITPFPRLPLAVCEMVSPLKPFEAMAMGKAVVASNVSALAEIVNDGVTGLLHKKGDPTHLAVQLRSLLDDRALRFRLGESALRWVRKERDWRVVASQVADIYSELLGARAPAEHGTRTNG